MHVLFDNKSHHSWKREEDLHNIGVIVPCKQIIQKFEDQASIIDNEIKHRDKEINILTELQSLLLAKMGH